MTASEYEYLNSEFGFTVCEMLSTTQTDRFSYFNIIIVILVKWENPKNPVVVRGLKIYIHKKKVSYSKYKRLCI